MNITSLSEIGYDLCRSCGQPYHKSSGVGHTSTCSAKGEQPGERKSKQPSPVGQIAAAELARQADSDELFATTLLAAMGGDADHADHARIVTLPGEPHVKERPRSRFTGKGHVYSAPRQKANEETARAFLEHEWGPPMEGRLVVVFLFYRRTGRRHDFDNLLKQVLDIGNGICWLDDSQIDDAVQRRRIDRERPRTVIAAARALGGEEPD